MVTAPRDVNGVRVGTSGFIYDDWRGRFYPSSARGAELEWYAAQFDTVELNVTFYRMPPSSTFRSWASRVPAGFLFAVKASRYLTHVKRLVDPRDAVEFLLERASELGPHLGPILIQLPPDMPADLDRLSETLACFPTSIKVAVEPRHPSWFTDELRDLLRDRGAALCIADRRGPVTPIWSTTNWFYLRFHAGRASPRPCYGARALQTWAETLAAQMATTATSYAYFNNDHHGCALRDAGVFARECMNAGLPVLSVPSVGDDVVGVP
jgi:uncharacterized protein YecE (DUF72 family)